MYLIALKKIDMSIKKHTKIKKGKQGIGYDNGNEQRQYETTNN